ncbi:MAG TPA: choice-of-anchor U domain-containing protein [Casimicrobiaceae bacterium]
MSIALQYPVDVHGSINSELSGFQIQAFDAGGNPVANVPITVRAPASGPSATLLISAANYNVVPSPDPLQVTVTIPANCQGALVWSIANGVIGSYQFVASISGGAQSLLIPATNTAPESPASVAAQDNALQRIAHIGSAFPPLPVVVRGASGLPIAGIPVTINLPNFGPSATFPDGIRSAMVVSDAFGRAIAPTLTANSEVGTFNLTVTAPGVVPVRTGPFVNAGATQVLLDDVQVDEPTNGFVDTFFITFGQTLHVRAWVIFPGLPLPAVQSPANVPLPNGKVVLRVDGNVVATSPIDQFYWTHICTGCPGPTLTFDFAVNAFTFGNHQLSASYEGDSAYESSSSVPNTVRAFPAATLPTATQAGASFIGVSGGAPDQWLCTLESPAWLSIAQLGAAAQNAPYSFPYGLLSYRLAQCLYHSPVFDFPPPLYQVLVLELPAPLPPGTVFVNYGPTRDNPAPHWYEIPAQIDGAIVRIVLSDGGAGDDELATSGVIAGLGGPALPAVSPATIQVIEFYAPSLDHYFMSADPTEIAALDTQAIPGWARTGMGFSAYSNAAANTQPVCRFYMPPQDGDSHFYSASIAECAQVRARFPEFAYESPDVFQIALPDASTGACAVGTVPVYRVWNQRADSNHRYTASRTIRDQMVARGYAAEGYGPDAVIMCAAPR